MVEKEQAAGAVEQVVPIPSRSPADLALRLQRAV